MEEERTAEPKPLEDQSPSEKLDSDKPISPGTPGAQQPGDRSIKNESGENTE